VYLGGGGGGGGGERKGGGKGNKGKRSVGDHTCFRQGE